MPHARGDRRVMHLHFVQSLEPLQGAGLGQASLSLHLAMRGERGHPARRATHPAGHTEGKQREAVDSAQQDANNISAFQDFSVSDFSCARSTLLSTRAADFGRTWPDVIQGVRRGPVKAYYAPELKRLAAEAVGSAEWFHGHGFYVWTNWWLGSEARRRGKPLVYHPHGFFDPWILHRSRGKKRVAHWLFEDANMAHVHWWRALSSKEADQIRAVVGSDAVVHVIPNGVDLAEVDSASVAGGGWRVAGNSEDAETRDSLLFTRHSAWTRRKRPKRLLFLSRIHPKKGLDLLVPAWGRLAKEFPDWELLIVGPDEGGYQTMVEKMIADGGCAETCRMHPAVSGAEKHALLRTADLFVLPSYSEGFPMAVLEAAAHRVAVVQTTECNFPELTGAGGAWECRPESAAVEVELRRALAADDTERAERGARGRKLVESNYSWDRLAEAVVEVCRADSV